MVRNIFVFILLSFFAYSINAADDDIKFVAIKHRGAVGYGSNFLHIEAKESDTVQDIIDRWCKGKRVSNRVSNLDENIKIVKTNKQCIETPITTGQTIANVEGLLHSSIYDCENWLELQFNKIIEITCRTLNGCEFKVNWNLGDDVQTLSQYILQKIIDEYPHVEDGKLKDCYEKLSDEVWNNHKVIRFIHARAEKLAQDTCAFQVEGLLGNPNLTIIIE